MKRKLLLAALAASVVLGGCAEESSLPNPSGEGTVRAINAIPGSPNVAFLIEERSAGTAAYKTATSSTQWDALSYTFNFEVILAGDTTTTRVASQVLEVVRDTDYTFLITGALNAPDITLVEVPMREWSGSETVFEVRFGNLGTTLGAVDFYLADEAIPPALGAQLATLSPGEVSDTIELDAADLVLTITPAGDDTTVLFQSDPVTFSEQNSQLINVFDGDENDIAPLAVRTVITSGLGGNLAIFDARFPPTFRFIHASRNMPTADIYLDDPLTVPIVMDHAYRDIDGPVDVTVGTLPLTYTETANMGNILIDEDIAVLAGSRRDLYIANDRDGNDRLVSHLADRRSILTFVQFIIFNAASGRDNVDLYFVDAGELLDDATPVLSGFPLAGIPVQIPLPPGSYEIYVTDVDEKVPLAGPIPLDAATGDVFEAILYDNVDPNIIDFEFLP